MKKLLFILLIIISNTSYSYFEYDGASGSIIFYAKSNNIDTICNKLIEHHVHFENNTSPTFISSELVYQNEILVAGVCHWNRFGVLQSPNFSWTELTCQFGEYDNDGTCEPNLPPFCYNTLVAGCRATPPAGPDFPPTCPGGYLLVQSADGDHCFPDTSSSSSSTSGGTTSSTTSGGTTSSTSSTSSSTSSTSSSTSSTSSSTSGGTTSSTSSGGTTGSTSGGSTTSSTSGGSTSSTSSTSGGSTSSSSSGGTVGGGYSGGDDCNTPVVCDDNLDQQSLISCGVSRQAWLLRCDSPDDNPDALTKETEAFDFDASIIEYETKETDAKNEFLEYITTLREDATSMFALDPVSGGSGSLPSNVITIFGVNVDFSLHRFESDLSIIGTVIILVSLLLSAIIIMSKG